MGKKEERRLYGENFKEVNRKIRKERNYGEKPK
jgi:hypothetical protein